jgi:hypothetical protein
MNFEKYVKAAESRTVYPAKNIILPENVEPLLNGEPYRAFRQLTSLESRRVAGCFFTGPQFADQLAASIRRASGPKARVMDPTCGIGDLLLAYARLLPLETTLHKTLISWGSQLAGLDLDPHLVRLAKLRIAMLARSRGGFSQQIEGIDHYFEDIRVGNMFKCARELGRADAFLFNPPFGIVEIPKKLSWASGSINAATLFLVELLEAKNQVAPIAAILPDVLRAGTRYRQFREYLAACEVEGDAVSLGRFDAWTDVDVFRTLLRPTNGGKLWQSSNAKLRGTSIGDFFDVTVGAVVPHRHDNKGPWCKYICARSATRWSSKHKPKNSRRFNGTTVTPPFVAVRRTSSPSDRNRAVGTIIIGDQPVAVENHLIVLKPKDNAVSTCKKALAVLLSRKTSNFLNIEIRCRHLTTNVVASIPWDD